MPNLISVERLARFYEADTNVFVILFISYKMNGYQAVISDVRFIPIEFLSWDCLTVGALGWGQIQVANSNYIKMNPQYSRKRWMLELCEALFCFYPREIRKIEKRVSRFEQVREAWLSKEDVWVAEPIESPQIITE